MSCIRGIGCRAIAVSLLILALTGVQAGELEERFDNTLKQAEAGNANAMYSLGEMYELGMGTANDRAKAMNWYRAAADKGHPEGLYQVGYAYYWGKAGLKKDRREAHAWFLRAAEAGSQAAMPYLAKMYRLGQGVKRDRAQAEVWSARAAAHSSSLRSAPPVPEARPATPAPVVAAPEPQPAPPAAAEPAPRPVARQTAPEPQPKVAAKPTPKPAPKPVAKAKPAPKPVDRIAQQKARLLGSWWQKGTRPSLYLPSARTDCELEGDEAILCASKPRRSSLLGRPYSFRIKARLETFDRQGRFAMRFWPEVTEILPPPPGAYGTGEDAPTPPTEEAIRQRVEKAEQELSCEMFGNTHMICTDDKGDELRFNRVDKGAAVARPEPVVAKRTTLPARQPLPEKAQQLDEPQDKLSASEEDNLPVSLRRRRLGR